MTWVLQEATKGNHNSVKENNWLFRISVWVKDVLIHSLNIGHIIVKFLESTGNLLSEFLIAKKKRVGFFKL